MTKQEKIQMFFNTIDTGLYTIDPEKFKEDALKALDLWKHPKAELLFSIASEKSDEESEDFHAIFGKMIDLEPLVLYDSKEYKELKAWLYNQVLSKTKAAE